MKKCKNLNCKEQLNNKTDMCFSCGMIQTKTLEKKIQLEVKNMIMTYNDQTLKEYQ